MTDDDRQHVWGLFGDRDDLVDTYDMFYQHYPQATHFHGEHRMDDQSYMHSVMPVIRWIDDQQRHRQRPIIYIGIESLTPRPHQGEKELKPLPSSQKAIRLLIEHYDVYFVTDTPQPETAAWLEEYINVPAWRHTIYTYRRDLLYGDYLISPKKEGDTMATLLEFGSDTFKTWDDIIDYFSHLGGQ